MGFLDIFPSGITVLETVDGRVACPRAGPSGTDVEVCHGCADVVDVQKLQTHYRVSCRRGIGSRCACLDTLYATLIG
jgi:hypothetical protein